MAYPKLIVNLKKIEENVSNMKENMAKSNLSILAGVTKVFCGNPEIAQAYMDGGIDILADSRIQNLEKLQKFDVPKLLLRIPMISEVEKVVAFADMSLNSEVETLKALNDAAKRENKTHKVILMADLGDLREGFFNKEELLEAAELVKELENLEYYGVGVNLTCYGAVIPKPEILKNLEDYADAIEEKTGMKAAIISGGNSSSVYMLGKEKFDKINNLRVGEALVLGTESAYGEKLPNFHYDAWKLEAEIVELKEKPSIPIGETGRDAFGRKPVFEDQGIRKRAIIAIGKQDVDNVELTPEDENIVILGGSSDHTILDVTDTEKEYKVGDIVRFDLNYVAVLQLNTSEYVEKEYITE